MLGSLISATLIFWLLASTSAEVILYGNCSNSEPPVKGNFSISYYLGGWYEYAKYPQNPEANGKCVTALYSLSRNGSIDVVNTLINETTSDYSEIRGNATVVANGKLLVKFHSSHNLNVSSNYWVLDTDYSNYSVVYSCVPLNRTHHSTNIWILTREAVPQPQTVEKSINVLRRYNLSLNALKMTNQISCPQVCSNDINVMKNFNLKTYMGKWYEYTKTPNEFEANGKCITAEYSLNKKGLVEVKNALVDENTNRYSEIHGTATVVSNAKLLVKFPVSPNVTVSSNYWVLGTDYKSFAVVYSCDPFTIGSRPQKVWILTRQPVPTPECIEKALDVVKNAGISLNGLRITNQISCSRY